MRSEADRLLSRARAAASDTDVPTRRTIEEALRVFEDVLRQRDRDLVYRARCAMMRIEAESGAERFDDFFAVVRDARGLAAMLSKVEAQVRSAKTDAACSGFLNMLDETLFDPDILAHGMKIAGEGCEVVEAGRLAREKERADRLAAVVENLLSQAARPDDPVDPDSLRVVLLDLLAADVRNLEDLNAYRRDHDEVEVGLAKENIP